MTAIEFENISKQYRLGLVSTHTLAHDIRRFWLTNVLGKEDPYLKIGETNDRSTKGSSEYVWALREINFKVEQGDVVGIIGKNGAGKSTLLKLLSRVTGPTTGTIRARGRIGSLLEVGTGFHPEMTGRENIFLNGAILGMTRQEIQKKLDEIVDFSGCERYIDTPVKRYSSGMMVRLGFAVAAHLDPEILVVDEVLAVGDAEFQKKAIGKMQDVSKGEGRTVLFVSHNMDSIRSLCHRGIVLSKGSVEFDGDVNEAVINYITNNSVSLQTPICERKDRLGSQNIKVNNISFRDENYNVINSVISGNVLNIVFEVETRDILDESNLLCEISLCNALDNPVVTWQSNELGFNFKGVKKTNRFVFTIPSLALRPSEYYLYFQFSEGNYQPHNWCDLMNHAMKIEVINSKFFGSDSLLNAVRCESLMPASISL